MEFRQQREEYEQRNDAQMAAMYEKLEKQMIELKSASMSAAGNRGAESELRNQLLIAKQQLETLKEENTQMRAALLQRPHGASNQDNQSHMHTSERVLELEKYVDKLEQHADKGILYQVCWCDTVVYYSVSCFVLCCPILACVSCTRMQTSLMCRVVWTLLLCVCVCQLCVSCVSVVYVYAGYLLSAHHVS